MADKKSASKGPESNTSSEEVSKDLAEARSFRGVGQLGPVQKVVLEKGGVARTGDQELWVAIRNRTSAIGFDQYANFLDRVLCVDDTTKLLPHEQRGLDEIKGARTELDKRPTIYGPDAYQLLKLATQAYLIVEAGVVIHDLRDSEGKRIADNWSLSASRLGSDETREEIEKLLGLRVSAAYLDRIMGELIPKAKQTTDQKLPYCDFILKNRWSSPSLLELIWSYWQEEGMLVQTMNAITMRFQNKRNGPRDPLANLEIDPLRPLNNLLWGFIQDEQNRLSVPRRAYEYDHHYGLSLVGKAVPRLQSADSRSKFVEAFHNLLHRASIFFREDADTTIQADAFPLLNALKEVHLILAEGAHNQFGDLPWTARAEMLTMQWLLARPEMRDFLRGRAMVPYHEKWMGAVDTMKKLQGWDDAGVMHFHELAVTGERIILSVRYGDWIDLNNTEDQAKNWAHYWKSEIQQYIHAYQAVTGVDLSTEVTDTRGAEERYLQPSVHLQRRLAGQRPSRALPASRSTGRRLTSEVTGYVALEVPDRRRLLPSDGE